MIGPSKIPFVFPYSREGEKYSNAIEKVKIKKP
jgi:hypothetical protein